MGWNHQLEYGLIFMPKIVEIIQFDEHSFSKVETTD